MIVYLSYEISSLEYVLNNFVTCCRIWHRFYRLELKIKIYIPAELAYFASFEVFIGEGTNCKQLAEVNVYTPKNRTCTTRFYYK